ncbi:hypothetical protein [Nocardioides sp.]|uniref:hypothetical protein n=1 Tax=Nocardioides sp. TaxID=35761 RepID=UPI002C327281|nr:hypothetical protein [Nocardioides sp.]HXH79410.1 hypothetical protein [Nocardioides sp.]
MDRQLRLQAASVHLPVTVQTLGEAAAAGSLQGRALDLPDSTTLPVSTESPVALAARAALATLGATGMANQDVDDLYYAWTYDQWEPFWSPAHALANRLGLSSAIPIGIQQMCNGGAAALHVVARAARAGADFRALVATGDVFRPPGFDRWTGDYGVLYGDAGTAVMADASGRPTPLGVKESTLLSLHTRALPHLESMHRTVGEPVDSADAERVRVVDVQASKRAYLAAHGSDSLAQPMQTLLRDLTTSALKDVHEQGLTLDGTAYLPRLMPRTLDALYLPIIASEFGLPVANSVDTGHLGAGDLIANLAEVQRDPREGAASDGSRVDLIVSAGAGFTITVAAVRTSMPSS